MYNIFYENSAPHCHPTSNVIIGCNGVLKCQNFSNDQSLTVTKKLVCCKNLGLCGQKVLSDYGLVVKGDRGIVV